MHGDRLRERGHATLRRGVRVDRTGSGGLRTEHRAEVTIDPPPWRCMGGTTARQNQNTLWRHSSVTPPQMSSVVAYRGQRTHGARRVDPHVDAPTVVRLGTPRDPGCDPSWTHLCETSVGPLAIRGHDGARIDYHVSTYKTLACQGQGWRRPGLEKMAVSNGRPTVVRVISRPQQASFRRRPPWGMFRPWSFSSSTGRSSCSATSSPRQRPSTGPLRRS